MSLRRLHLAALVLAALIPSLMSRGAAAAPFTDRQLAAGSPHVVVAVVEEARSRWNGAGNLIVTDYGLRIEERLKGEAPARVVLTMPGGTVGGETHGTSLSTPLATGGRYLLFLGDLERPTFTPVTGGWQGVFREAAGTAGTKAFSAAVQTARALIADSSDLAARPEPVEDPRLPAKTYDPASAKFVVRDPAVPPIVFNPIVRGSRFYQQDQKQMAYWNVYARGLFQVSRSPSRSWAFGNGVFDIAGFPTSAQLEQQLGRGWGSGANLVIFRLQNGHIVEADLAFNPAFSWSVDDEASSRPGGPVSFKDAVLSGLGVAWGYQGIHGFGGINLTPVSRDSIENAKAQPYRLATLFAEDAQAVRATFPGTSIRDGLISPYGIQPSPLTPRYVPVTASAASARAGTGFNLVNPVKIENAGTADLAGLSVDVYLVKKRFSLAGAILLKKVRLSGALRPGEAADLDLGRVTLPASVPAGSYAFAFVLRVPRDGYPGNNSAWSNADVRINVTR